MLLRVWSCTACGTRSLRACVLQGAGVLRRVRCDLADAVRRPPGVTPAQRCNGATVHSRDVRHVGRAAYPRTHAHAHAHMRARTHTHSHARAHTHTHPSTRTQTHERRNTRMHARTYEQACAHIHRRTRTHSHCTAAAAAGWVATGTSRNGKQKDGDNGDRLQ